MTTAVAPRATVRTRPRLMARSGVARIVVSRLIQLVSVALFVVLVTSVLVHLVPGDPALAILGQHATPSSLAALRHQMGLDRSLVSQIGSSVGNIAQGDLGASLTQSRSVSSIVFGDLGVTVSVIGLTLVLALLIGAPLGLLAAVSGNGWIDKGTRVLCVALLTLPPFFAGLLLQLLVSLQLDVAPAGGWGTGWPDNLRYAWLPALALCCYLVPLITRAVRQAARETLAEPHVEAVIARGIAPRAVVFRHVLPNSLLPVVTLIGFNAAALIGGAVVVEAVFGLPGVGSELVTAVQSRDFPVVQGIALITAVVVVCVNLITDLVYGFVDPRIRRATS